VEAVVEQQKSVLGELVEAPDLFLVAELVSEEQVVVLD
jgi:hypothetical protein